MNADDPLTKVLDAFAARPRRATNGRATTMFALLLLWLVFTARLSDAPTALVAAGAVSLSVLYLGLHLAWRAALAALSRRGVQAAARALRTYHEPRRTNDLDLCLAWTGVAMISRLIGLCTD